MSASSAGGGVASAPALAPSLAAAAATGGGEPHDGGEAQALAPHTDEWKSMKEAREAIATVLFRRSLPSYTLHSSRDRLELQCPRTKQGVTCTFVLSAAREAIRNRRVRITRSCLEHTCGCTEDMKDGPGGRRLRVPTGGVGRRAAANGGVGGAAPPFAAIQGPPPRLAGLMGTTWAWQRPVPRPPQDDEELSYQLIRPYFSKLERRMPGTVTHLERDDGGRLLRTFVLLAPLATALKWFKPVLCFRAWNLQWGRGGVLMACTMRDGSGQTQLLAWGTAPTEGVEDWEWFVAKLDRGLPAPPPRMTRPATRRGVPRR
jgi:hypothetical protein